MDGKLGRRFVGNEWRRGRGGQEGPGVLAVARAQMRIKTRLM